MSEFPGSQFNLFKLSHFIFSQLLRAERFIDMCIMQYGKREYISIGFRQALLERGRGGDIASVKLFTWNRRTSTTYSSHNIFGRTFNHIAAHLQTFYSSARWFLTDLWRLLLSFGIQVFLNFTVSWFIMSLFNYHVVFLEKLWNRSTHGVLTNSSAADSRNVRKLVQAWLQKKDWRISSAQPIGHKLEFLYGGESSPAFFCQVAGAPRPM